MPVSADGETYYTTSEACRRAGIGKSTFLRWVKAGIIASKVRDTGVAGARWDALFWDETVEADTTDITFEVRASGALFAEDTPPETLPWISVAGNSPVTSGLPSGRYMQWRATLTTSDTLKTPTLHEVRVHHY